MQMDIKLLRFDFPPRTVRETPNYKKIAISVVVVAAIAAISTLQSSYHRIPTLSNTALIAKFFNYKRPDFGIIFQNGRDAFSLEVGKFFEFLPLVPLSEKLRNNSIVYGNFKDADDGQTLKTPPATNQLSLNHGQSLFLKRFDLKPDNKVDNVCKYAHVHVPNDQIFTLNSKPNPLSQLEIFNHLLVYDKSAAKKYALKYVQKSDQLNPEKVFKAFLKSQAGKESQEFASECVKMGANCTLNPQYVLEALLDGKFSHEAHTFMRDCHREKDRCQLNFEKLHKDLLVTNPYRARWLGIRCIEAGIRLCKSYF